MEPQLFAASAQPLSAPPAVPASPAPVPGARRAISASSVSAAPSAPSLPPARATSTSQQATSAAPYVPPQGPYSGSQQVAIPAVAPVPGHAATLADATVAAHAEGMAFGASVARDAPALWLEAVLARKPRMPSDLEARLLQGSSLPIDFLLHDEVRHALRRGFWDALDRARR
jgi:hypothetical protein